VRGWETRPITKGNNPFTMIEDQPRLSKSPSQVHLAQMNLSENELTIISEVSLAATQLLDKEDILDLALDTFSNKLGMAVVMVYLLDPELDRYTLHASHGLSGEQKEEIERRRRSGHDITQEVIDTGEGVFVPDMSADHRFYGVWDNLEGRSYVKLPLVSRGTVVGVVGSVTPENQSLSPRSVEYLKVIGGVIGIAIDNANLLADTRRREQHAKSLHNLGMKISSTLSPTSVLESAAKAFRELMDADIGLVGLVDVKREEMIIEAISGRRTKNLPDFQAMSMDRYPWKELATGQPIEYHQPDHDQPILYEDPFITQESVKSFLAVPLMRGSALLGLVVVMYRKPHRFSSSDIDVLSPLTHQVVLSIENAQLYRQLHHMAALEERDRLARELHDNLSQTLGYLKIKASITDDLLERGKVEKAKVSLGQLKMVSERLYIDVREEIFKLRTDVGVQRGFFNALQGYLSDYRTYYGLHVDLAVENESLRDISPDISCQLLRIIQEALTNVRKHAEASKVLVYCEQDDEQIRVRIEDDGKGFHLSNVLENEQGNYGLQIMKERAEGIGGCLAVNSTPKKGTQVVVCAPLDTTG
jgi:two-component system nitrate/nitrite sensor histidine kinase NarX